MRDDSGATDLKLYYNESTLSPVIKENYFALMCAQRVPVDNCYTTVMRPISDYQMVFNASFCNGGVQRTAALDIVYATNKTGGNVCECLYISVWMCVNVIVCVCACVGMYVKANVCM